MPDSLPSLSWYLKNPELVHEMIGKILNLIESQGIEVPETARFEFLDLIGVGQRWINAPEETKKKIRKYRTLLQNARDYRDSLTITWDSDEGPIRLNYPNSIPLLTDHLDEMIEDCDEILGTKEPTRYPRRKIIEDVLALWIKYTGKTPQKCAIQPSSHSEDKEAPPYTLCRLVLTAIEDCKDSGDFRRFYERAVAPILK